MSDSFVLYSDGGGEKSSSAAGACVIQTPSNRLHLMVFLGAATNNEAEICAGLLGFSALQLLAPNNSKVPVRWVCDSEYTLKSATQYIYGWQKNGWKTAAKKPVKNQGLWRAYLLLSRPFKVDPTHVYGHTGHAENEACDTAATWARNHAFSYLAQEGDGVSVFSVGDGEEWLLFDGREFLAELRESGTEDVTGEVAFGLKDKLSEADFSGGGAGERFSSLDASSRKPTNPFVLESALKSMKEIELKLKAADSEDGVEKVLGYLQKAIAAAESS